MQYFKTLMAFKLARLKWFLIKNKLKNDYGKLDCALCRTFQSDHSGCGQCPVVEFTGSSSCRRTPYEDWSYTTDYKTSRIGLARKLPKHDRVRRGAALEAAKQEYDFLTFLEKEWKNAQRR